jgi:hypothetical protein
LLKVWREKLILSKWYIAICLCVYLVANYINVDKIIVEQNIERYKATKEIDIQYLSGLSYDAVPILVEFIEQNKGKVQIWGEVDMKLKKEKLENYNGWQAYNISSEKAKEALKNMK